MHTPILLLSQPSPLFAVLMRCQCLGQAPAQKGAVPNHRCVNLYRGRLQPQTTRYGPSALSSAVRVRVAGVTQTWSPGRAERQTKPCLQVSGPKGPPPGWTREAAAALSAAAWLRTAGVTQTWSLGKASRQT